MLVLDMVGTILILSLIGTTVLVITEITWPIIGVDVVLAIDQLLMLDAVDFQIELAILAEEVAITVLPEVLRQDHHVVQQLVRQEEL